MLPILCHLVYLVISIGFTVFVGNTLFVSGREFLLECFPKGATADSINRLFLAGFYLMNTAFICIALRLGDTSETLVGLVQIVSYRVGLVTLVMGLMHFNNLFWCNLIREIRLANDRRFLDTQ